MRAVGRECHRCHMITLNPEDSQKACPVSGLSICPDGMMGLTGRLYKTG
jgi:hypothetical protein